MKKSIKNSVLVIGLLGLVMGAKAQTSSSTATSSGPNGIIYSIGADGGLTTGASRDLHKWEFGGSIEADIPVVKSLYISVNAGYNNFFNNDAATGSSVSDINLLPVKAGLKYFPVSCFYIQGEAGAAFALNKSSVGYSNTAAFIYSPQLGFVFHLGGRSYLDAGVYYESSSDFTTNADQSKINFFGLRAAYAFTIK